MDFPYAIEHAQPTVCRDRNSPVFSGRPARIGRRGYVNFQVSEEYAERVMWRWGYSKDGVDKCREIARRLTWDYPTHGFIIDLTEAKEIGLKAQGLDAKSDSLSKEILQETTDYIVLAFPDTKDNQTDTSDSQQEDNKETHAHATEQGDETVERSPDGRPVAISP